MYLSKIKLTGFKSFPDTTEITFPERVTAIVGPNGCGKSNIADALRWVLGEQSTKALRAERMEDVIFSGSRDKPPLGMAEVEITLDGCAGLDGDDDQITITRRFFRSRESQFFINKQSCRLKDIQSLLVGTGLGKSAYSVLEQGMVDVILSSKPEERRTVIDEAAGITGYRKKREETMHKLEKAEDNLLRLSDIIEEVRRQAEGLKRQAEKARVFSEQRWELVKLASALTKRDREELRGRLAKLDKELEGLELRREQLSAKLTAGEEGSAQLRLEGAECSGKMVHLTSEIEEKSELLKDLEREIAVLNTQREAYRQERVEKEADLVGLEEGLEGLRKEEGVALDNFGVLGKRQERISALAERCDLLVEGRKERLSAMETRVMSLKEDIVDVNARQSAGRGKLEELRVRLGESSISTERLDEEFSKLTTRRKEMEKVVGKLEGRISSAQADIAQKDKQVALKKSELASLQEEEHKLEWELGQLEVKLATTESRIGWLEGLVAEREGLGRGARALLLGKEKDKAGFSWLLGSLLESIEVDEGYQLAIASALEPWRKALVVSNRGTALSQASRLTKAKRGRAILIPGDIPKAKEDGRKRGLLCWADEVVSARGKFGGVISYLLGQVGVVKDLAQGIALMQSDKLPAGGVVTLQGEVLLEGGIVVAGSGEEDSPLVGRKRALKLEKEKAKGLHRRQRQLAKELVGLVERKSGLEGRVEEAREQLKQAELGLEGLRVELDILGRDASEVARREELDRREKEDLKGAIKDFRESLKGQEKSLALDEKRKEELSVQLADCEGSLSRLTISVESAKRRQSNVALIQAENERDLKRATEELARIRARIEEVQGQMEGRRQRIVELDGLVKDGQVREVTLKGKIGEEGEALKAVQGMRQDARKEMEPIEKRVSRLEGNIKELREKEQRLSEKISGVRVRREKREGRLNSLEETFLARYGKALDEQLGELAGLPSLKDEAKVKERVAELTQELSAMGNINFAAGEEYEQLRKREQFLSGQENDLLQAKENLLATIQHIDDESTIIFMNTFNQASESFSEIFSYIFGGGKARLSLEEDKDPLEAGLIIEAQPPGKRMRSLSLLSGGERALVAIALLFALYLVKPTPFYILDEVDAPLDDPNIDRFIGLLNRFKEETQFILITHNKRTMEVADVLYGVTMEVPGISQMVSINLKEREEEYVG